jgi:hypothetical protein
LRYSPGICLVLSKAMNLTEGVGVLPYFRFGHLLNTSHELYRWILPFLRHKVFFTFIAFRPLFRKLLGGGGGHTERNTDMILKVMLEAVNAVIFLKTFIFST